MGTGSRRNRKTRMARLIDHALRIILTGAFSLVKRRARRRRGVHAVALTPEGRIILVKLRYAPGWRLPGGGLDGSEDLEDAALRELREEIGMVAHGSVRRGLGDPDPVLIVENVEYRPPRWSWEVEAIIETPLDGLPGDMAFVAARWLSALRDRLAKVHFHPRE
jgi:8-oxo-dGTP pyrophosphatase MutT (NUDIX family)